MATAVMELYPGTKISIGPADRERLLLRLRVPGGGEGLRRRPRPHRGADARHVEADEPFERTDVAPSRGRAATSRAEGQDYKVELIRDLVANEGVKTVSLYRNGPFTDLCRGPHGPSTGRIKAFKLLSLAGAYWRGDERNQMLTRIYGTAFLSKEDLERHLEMLEQARARDHRRLGPAARPVPAAPGVAGHAVLPAERDGRRQRDPARRARAARAARLRGDPHAAHPRRGALEALGPLGQLPREHVLHAAPATRTRASSRSSR